jgi:hypothetical protein
MPNHHTKFRNFSRKGEAQSELFYDQLRLWLRATLADDQRRAELQSLLLQSELPVIQIGKSSKRIVRTTPQRVHCVNPAKT